MAISLQKGGTVNLNKVNEGISLQKGNSNTLQTLHVGLGWDVHSRVQADLDAFVVQVGPNGQVMDTVYFGKKNSTDGAIKHSGDNLTGAGEGDDEVIFIDLNKLNPSTQKVVVAVNIYQCRTTFNDIQNAFIRLLNKQTGDLLMQYSLSEDKGKNYAMIMGEVVKNADGTWSFNAIGLGTTDRSVSDVTNRIKQGLNMNFTQVDMNQAQFTAPQGQPQKKGLFGKLFG